MPDFKGRYGIVDGFTAARKALRHLLDDFQLTKTERPSSSGEINELRAFVAEKIANIEDRMTCGEAIVDFIRNPR